MKRVVTVLAAAAILAVAAIPIWYELETQEETQVTARVGLPAVEVQAEEAETPIEERVIKLPEDGGVYHTSVFVHTDWRSRPEERAVLAWFATEPRLVSLKAQTHFHTYTDAMPLVMTRFAGTVTDLPCVMVQRHTGEVRFKLSGENLPQDAGTLAEQIAKTLWPCPCPKPRPTPDTDVDVDVDIDHTPEVVPDINVEVQPADEPEFPWGIMLACCLAAVGLVLILHFKY